MIEKNLFKLFLTLINNPDITNVIAKADFVQITYDQTHPLIIALGKYILLMR